MELDRYRSVVRMVLARHVPDADRVTGELYATLEVAEALVTEMNTGAIGAIARRPPQRETGSSMPASMSAGETILPAAFTGGAPPVALADGAEDEPARIDIDYWESRPGKGDGTARLQSMLEKNLPQSIEVHPPGFDAPFAIVRGLGSPGLKFVHVSYVIPGDTLGPRVTLMTSQKTFDVMAIERDVRTQAESIYSREKRVIAPRIAAPVAPPSTAEMQRMLDLDRARQASTPPTQEDHRVAQEWAASRSPEWR